MTINIVIAIIILFIFWMLSLYSLHKERKRSEYIWIGVLVCDNEVRYYYQSTSFQNCKLTIKGYLFKELSSREFEGYKVNKPIKWDFIYNDILKVTTDFKMFNNKEAIASLAPFKLELINPHKNIKEYSVTLMRIYTKGERQ